MVHEIALRGEIEESRRLIVGHWRRSGRITWSQADLDSAIERLLEITNSDRRVIRQVLKTGIVAPAGIGQRGKRSTPTATASGRAK